MGQIKEAELKKEDAEVDELIKQGKIERAFPAPGEDYSHRALTKIGSDGKVDDRRSYWSDYYARGYY